MLAPLALAGLFAYLVQTVSGARWQQKRGINEPGWDARPGPTVTSPSRPPQFVSLVTWALVRVGMPQHPIGHLTACASVFLPPLLSGMPRMVSGLELAGP